jgi:hypothetical protein
MNLLTNVTYDRYQSLLLTLRPNPAKGFTNLVLREALDEDLTVYIRDLNSKLLKSLRCAAGQTEWPIYVADLPSAMYFVQIKGKSYFEIRKIVVE